MQGWGGVRAPSPAQDFSLLLGHSSRRPQLPPPELLTTWQEQAKMQVDRSVPSPTALGFQETIRTAFPGSAVALDCHQWILSKQEAGGGGGGVENGISS